jgi:hypothetical protein
MSNQKMIAVAGATGSQGGGLVLAILADKGGEYSVLQFFTECEKDFRAARPLQTARSLDPKLQDLRGWLKENKGKLQF